MNQNKIAFTAPAVLLCAMLLALLASPNASAALTVYTDAGLWAAAAGTPDVFEDFESFLVDDDFSFTTTTAPAGFSLTHSGTDDFRNVIDVPPITFDSESNGTASASIYLDGDGGATVQLDLDTPATAIGFDISDMSGGGGEGAIFSLLGSSAVAASSTPINSGTSTFLGFVATSGDFISSVVMEGQGGQSAGEGFFLDNVRAVSVPEPSSALLLFIATLLVRRRR